MGTRLISWNINHKPRSVSNNNSSSCSRSSRNTANTKVSIHVSLCLCVCSSQKRRILDQDFGYAYAKKQKKLFVLALKGSGHGSMANCRSFSFFRSLPDKNGIAIPIGTNGNFDGHSLPYRNKATRFTQRKTLVFCSFPVEDGNNVRASDRINGTFDRHNLPYGGKEKFRKRRTLSFYAKLIKFLRTIRSFLPGGTWWEIRGLNQGDEEKISVMSAMHRLWILIAPDGLIVGIAFFALVVAAFSEIAIPHYVAATIFSAQSGLKQEFLRNAQFLAIVTCTFGLFSGIRGGSFGIANQILVQRMRERLFSTMLSQDIAFFDEESVGILTSRLGSDCQQVSRILGHDLNIMLRNALQGLGSFFYLTTISKPLALSTLIICSIMWCIMTGYGRFQRRVARSAQDSIAAANKVAEENLSLARVIRTFGTEKQEISRYSRWTKHLVEINLRQNVAYGFWTWSANTLYNATQVVALLIGGSYVFMGKISAEQLTKFVLYSEWVVHSTWWVGDHWALLMQSIGASEKVFELMDLTPSRQLTNQGIQLPTLEGKIQFKNVSFQYPTRPSIPVLRRVNLCIQPGEVVAVVGLSGSGKSTLAGLLLRHYDPSIGEILIDGVPLNKLDIKWLRRQLGVVSQEPKLFSTDIASNIAYGCGGTVTSIEIEKAAKQANAHDFIMGLPEGYRTTVDNARLSGGQKQRIAIARALVRDPSILILDEATSALDAESEHFVQKALHKAMHDGRKKRTVLVIAHRLSTIRSADRIVVMQSGCISEIGTHDELLRLDGEYAMLTRRQMSTI